jgi:hypothetical protein
MTAGDRILALLPAEEASAYRLLGRFGITPLSPARAVLDVTFEMRPEELQDPELNRAWESLRTPRTRLELDFFLLDLPQDGEPSPGPAPALAPAAEPPELPLPRQLLAALARAEPPALPGEAPAEEPFDPPPALDSQAVAR